MNDLISRQAAIYAADMADYPGLSIEDVDKVTGEVVKALKELPSAQLELSDEEKRLYKKLRSYHNGSYAKLLDKMMPSAQPERKTGRWYKPQGYSRDSYRFICDNCHDVAYFVTGNNGKKNKSDNPKCGYRYCPHCGIRMDDKTVARISYEYEVEEDG